MKEKIKKTANQIKNKTISEDLLRSYRGALEKVREYFDSVNDMKMDDVEDIDKYQKTIAFILKCGADLGKNIETLAVLEAKVQKDEDIKGKSRGNNKLGLFEDGQ